jgi:glycosyltransferase involved in cell wall biosynthesis
MISGILSASHSMVYDSTTSFPSCIPNSSRVPLKVRLLPLFRALVRIAARQSAAGDHRHFEHAASRDIVRLLGRACAGTMCTSSSLRAEYAANPKRRPDSRRARPSVCHPGSYFLLYVGRHDPYKGLAHLLRAYAEAYGAEPSAAVHVAVVGKSDDRYGYGKLVAELGIGDRVHFLGYVDARQLSALYAHACAYVHPSLYEGFGLPPLDAMRHGTPVISSDRASLPEVVGDAAMLVDPEHTAVFARRLRNVAENTTLRTQFIRKGYEHVARFSWNHTAQQTVEVYTHVLDVIRQS